MSNNPYQPFFDRLDRTVDALDDIKGLEAAREAADLLKRAGFVLANMLNVQAQVYPTLFLEPEAVEGEANDTDASSVLDPETHDDIMAQDYE